MSRPGASREGTPLIVGLGNPGREYAATRHNWVGLRSTSSVRTRSIPGGFKKKFQGEFAKGDHRAAESACFLRPETYMNESGRSVQGAVAFFHAAPRDVIVLHDELDLPFGEVRVKLGGGHAGHNGLRSLIADSRHARIRARAHGGRAPAARASAAKSPIFCSRRFSTDERGQVPDIVTRGRRRRSQDSRATGSSAR